MQSMRLPTDRELFVIPSPFDALLCRIMSCPLDGRNHVPMELASRIQRFVEHAHSQQQKKMSIQAGSAEERP